MPQVVLCDRCGGQTLEKDGVCVPCKVKEKKQKSSRWQWAGWSRQDEKAQLTRHGKKQEEVK